MDEHTQILHEIRLMREENYFYARAAVAVTLASILGALHSDVEIESMATGLMDEARVDAAAKVK